MDMEKHISVLGILHIIYSVLGLFAGAVIFAIFSGIGFIVRNAGNTPDGSMVDVPSLFLVVGSFVAGLLVLFSLPGVIGGIGLLKHKEWARILVLVVGFFDLLHIPLGTVLGIYTIWVLFNSEAIKLFRPQASVSTTAPPTI
jgi:hypothetical protein